MTVPYSMRQQGEMFVDNVERNSINEELARQFGLPLAYARQREFTCDTLTCKCCGGVQIKNPDRVRERFHCPYCNWFRCDACQIASTLPGYVHESLQEKADKLKAAFANIKCI